VQLIAVGNFWRHAYYQTSANAIFADVPEAQTWPLDFPNKEPRHQVLQALVNIKNLVAYQVTEIEWPSLDDVRRDRLAGLDFSIAGRC
jgi:hypothetical protein